MHATFRTAHSGYENNRKFHQWDAETESLSFLLENLKPDLIISAMRGDFKAQIYAHQEAVRYILKQNSKLIFLSSANVFDAFTNYPSYEYDKTFSHSIYGKFKIQIENDLLRLPNTAYNIFRLPMIFGANSPRIEELKTMYKVNDAIEVFPTVVLNAGSIQHLTRQIHYLINRNAEGIYHLGSTDLIHHEDLIMDICEKLQFNHPKITRVYESNDDRYLAILPKTHRLPEHLEYQAKDILAELKLG